VIVLAQELGMPSERDPGKNFVSGDRWKGMDVPWQVGGTDPRAMNTPTRLRRMLLKMRPPGE
jgi:hypothetical protein